jgi:hypothetical protein
MKAILGKLNDELLINLAAKAAPFCVEVDAAIAYAEGSDHPLLKSCKDNGLRLNFYGLLDETGAVSPSLLRELLKWGPTKANACLVKGNFHAKVIWWRGYGAYIGSANLTHKAWFNNIEAGVFVDEAELTSCETGADLDRMFDRLADVAIPVTDEVVRHLETLATARRPMYEQEAKLKKRFKELFGHLSDNPGLTSIPAKGQKENKALKRFSTEWMRTLQLMRGLARDFAALDLRPTWVRPDAHPAIHFDQFLHAYYYKYVRDSTGEEEDDDDLSGLEKVENSFAKNRGDTKRALEVAARWWASLPSDVHEEEVFIHQTAPAMQGMFAREALRSMDLPAFRDAMRYVNAFRMHARQMKNVELGLPAGHKLSADQRLDQLCAWLWEQRTPGGKTVRDVLEYVIWGATPLDMEQRLWIGVWGDDYRLSHFGQSSLGEAVGWARPDDYPPRNNRTNKALRALGHDVKLFSKG